MKIKLPIKIATFRSYIRPITLRKFLLLAKNKQKFHDDEEYINYYSNDMDWKSAMTVNRLRDLPNPSVRTTKMLNKLVIESAIQQAVQVHITVNNFNEIIDEMAWDYINEMGQPEYLIRVGPRQWMVSNTSDYAMFYTDTKIAVVCINPSRQFIYNIKKAI